jgi:spermidine/putrescine transport system ATP-binding protein
MANTGPAAVEFVNLSRRFGGVTALDQVSLAIAPGEFFSLLGPSGCGKTTLLRIIAGLDVPDEGTLRISGVDALGVPAHRRPVNTVFQSYALFPHLSVWDNVAFGLRMKRVPRPQIASRVQKILSLMEIEALAQRKPAQLSGGEKQRVALARAAVNEPEVLLLDEPLGALDLQLRKQLQVELRRLQRRLAITFLYVTHDQEEALVLSDRIAVMRNGRIEQVGEAQTVYEHPRTRFAGQFLGSCTLLDATPAGPGGNGPLVSTPVGLLRLDGAIPARERFTLAIRPEKLHLCSDHAAGGENHVPVQIEQIVYVGSETHYELRAGPQVLRAEVMNAEAGSQAFRLGQEAVAYLPPAALIILDD